MSRGHSLSGGLTAAPLDYLATCESDPLEIPASADKRIQIKIKELALRLDLSLKLCAFSPVKMHFHSMLFSISVRCLHAALRQICYPPLASPPLLPSHLSLPPATR